MKCNAIVNFDFPSSFLINIHKNSTTRNEAKVDIVIFFDITNV